MHFQTCFGATGDQMTCQMPKFNLSDASNDAKTTQDPSAKSRKKRHLFLSFYSSFVEKTQNFYRTLIWNSKNPTFSYTSMPDSVFNDGRLLKRHRRSSGNDNPVSTFTINNKTYNLFLKFTLDSYPKYEDLSKSLPNITFTLVDSRPGFPSGANKQQQSFDPSQNEPITILVCIIYLITLHRYFTHFMFLEFQVHSFICVNEFLTPHWNL